MFIFCIGYPYSNLCKLYTNAEVSQSRIRVSDQTLTKTKIIGIFLCFFVIVPDAPVVAAQDAFAIVSCIVLGGIETNHSAPGLDRVLQTESVSETPQGVAGTAAWISQARSANYLPSSPSSKAGPRLQRGERTDVSPTWLGNDVNGFGTLPEKVALFGVQQR
jgi:hypothetical protein